MDIAASQIKPEARGQHILRVHQAGVLATLLIAVINQGELRGFREHRWRQRRQRSQPEREGAWCSAHFLHLILPAPTSQASHIQGNLPSQLTLREAPSQTPSEVVSSVILCSVELAGKVDEPAILGDWVYRHSRVLSAVIKMAWY